MVDRLFVYGTLRSTFDHGYARLLRSTSVFEGQARVRGAVRRVDDYPAFLPDEHGEVAGELYRMNQPEELLAALDDYEGEKYQRTLIDVNGAPAWIYALRRNA